MARQRSGSSQPQSWADSSVIFSDTERVDLFDDPRWETSTRYGSSRRTSGQQPSSDDGRVWRRIRRRPRK